jgi:hypothetical protein
MHKMNADCPVACKMFNTLQPLLKTAEMAMAGALSNTTLKELAGGWEAST